MTTDAYTGPRLRGGKIGARAPGCPPEHALIAALIAQAIRDTGSADPATAREAASWLDEMGGLWAAVIGLDPAALRDWRAVATDGRLTPVFELCEVRPTELLCEAILRGAVQDERHGGALGEEATHWLEGWGRVLSAASGYGPEWVDVLRETPAASFAWRCEGGGQRARLVRLPVNSRDEG